MSRSDFEPPSLARDLPESIPADAIRDGLATVGDGLQRVGVRGCLKSVYYSLRHTSRPTALALHSNVLTDIHPETSFDIDDRLVVGLPELPASHPRLMRSKLSTAVGSTVSQTGDGRAFIGPGSVLSIEGDFEIGHSYCNSHARILCSDAITIGDGVAIAWDCELLDRDFHQLVVDGVPSEGCSPIEIQDHVWIGHDVAVHKGVTIHEGSVVASNSVVKDDVPPRTLAAGCPARVIKEDIEWR